MHIHARKAFDVIYTFFTKTRGGDEPPSDVCKT